MVCITIQNKTNKKVSNNNNMLILLLSKIQALHILYLGVVIIYSVMIQCITVLNINIPQKSLVCKTRKATAETVLKQLEYVTKGHIATQTTLL